MCLNDWKISTVWWYMNLHYIADLLITAGEEWITDIDDSMHTDSQLTRHGAGRLPKGRDRKVNSRAWVWQQRLF